MLATLMRLVGVVQLLLGVLYLAVPDWLLAAMGHSSIAADIRYPLGMLAARFFGVWRRPAMGCPTATGTPAVDLGHGGHSVGRSGSRGEPHPGRQRAAELVGVSDV